MPYQNRVTPFGELERSSARGLMMGNRGILHAEDGSIGVSRWKHKTWIICVLSFKGRHRRVMSPNRYTELFFLDEAVALAAGHRPCWECRHADADRFTRAWRAGNGIAAGTPLRAHDIDETLHPARVDRRRRQIRTRQRIEDLPDGCLIEHPDHPDTAWLLRNGWLHRWTHGGYRESEKRGTGMVTLLTPVPTMHALRAGYQPMVHPSAG